jgi:hypothetical protein
MKLAIAVFGAAALVGIGYVIGKKVIEKKKEREEFYDMNDFDDLDDEEDIDLGVYAKESYGSRFRKAGLFAVGAIKTGADKIGETIQDIKTKDMVKKGEQTVGACKETGENIKNDIKRDLNDLKDMVASIDDEEDEKSQADDLFDSLKKDDSDKN